MSQWEQFVEWGRVLAVDVDLDENERAYKVEVASRLADVREQVLANEPGWPDELRRVLTSTNLLDRFLRMSLIQDLRTRPTDMRHALLGVWGGDPDLTTLDGLASALRPLSDRYTPGNALSLGALLLMARDPAAYPPFRARAVAKWARLTGFSATPPNASVSMRYAGLLAFCDELLRRAELAGLDLRDRLDAQGLAWTITGAAPPEAWPLQERNALLRFRGDPMARTDDGEADVLVERGVGTSTAIEDAAWLVLEPGLKNAPSPLDPSLVTWTVAAADELLERVEGGDETSKDSFLTKLDRQLAGAPRDVVLLAAELLYLQVLPLSNVKGETKRERLETVLSWLDAAPG